MKNTLRIITIYLLCLVLTGCVYFDDSGANAESGNPEATNSAGETKKTELPSAEPNIPVSGGTLNLSMRHPLTLNPLLNEDETVDRILSLIFEPVAVLDENLRPAANPALVQSIDLSSDMLSVLVTLRDEAVWSDGTKITAKDLQFSLETLKNAPDTVIYKESVSNVLSMNVINDTTLKINLIQPYGQMLYLLCFPIIPSHYYKGVSAENAKQMKPLGNGVFIYESYKVSEALILRASDKSLRGPSYIETVNIIITPDEESDFYAFEQGVTDAVVYSAADRGRLSGPTGIHAAEFISQYFDFIGFNFDNEILADKAIREAVAYSTPVSWIYDAVFLGYGLIAPTPVNPALWLAEPAVFQREFNLEKAAGLVKSSELDISGLRILVNEENGQRVKIAETLAENLTKIGITCEVIKEPFEEYEKLLAARDYDIFIGGYRLSAVPDLTFMLHSSEAETGSNIFNYRAEQMDSLLQSAFSAAGEYNSIKAYSELQKYISEELPLIGLVYKKSALLLGRRVRGSVSATFNNVFANIEEWYIIE